jgi:hypothetical protein
VRSAPIFDGEGGLLEGKVAWAGVCVRGRLAGGRGGGVGRVAVGFAAWWGRVR